MLSLYVRNGLEQGRIYPLDPARKAFPIGRALASAVFLADDGISRRHAEIIHRDGQWVLRDLESTNGTFLNALPVREKRIAARDVIMLGPVELMVVDHDPASPPGRGADETGVRRAMNLRTTEAIPVRLAHGIRGSSAGMLGVIDAIASLSQLDTTVLIRGETGTGKELVARAIHASSRRGRGPFVAVNCGAIPEGLVESELFGHEAGSFTGAAARRCGHFEEASGGTLFLDEVGDLPMATQAKLLRMFETRALRRVGGDEEVRVDVRILAATHRDLERAVGSRAFREDLYHRLRVAEIVVPPLRQRPSDIPSLARYFLTTVALETGRQVLEIGEEAIGLLQDCPWPGNVRELRNAIERAAILASSRALTPADFSFLPMSAPAPSAPDGEPFLTLRAFEEIQVRRHIARAIAFSGGNKTRAAQLLGISRQTLYEKLQQDPPPSASADGES